MVSVPFDCGCIGFGPHRSGSAHSAWHLQPFGSRPDLTLAQLWGESVVSYDALVMAPILILLFLTSFLMSLTVPPFKRLISARLKIHLLPSNRRQLKHITLLGAVQTTAGTGNAPLPFLIERGRFASLRRLLKQGWRSYGGRAAVAVTNAFFGAFALGIITLQVCARPLCRRSWSSDGFPRSFGVSNACEANPRQRSRPRRKSGRCAAFGSPTDALPPGGFFRLQGR